MNAVEVNQREILREEWSECLPSNGLERLDNLSVGLPVLIDDIRKTHTEDSVEDDVGGVEKRLEINEMSVCL